ncbi:MAG: DUF1080 domain-containing protein [Phycisphaerae bacterium]
MTNVRCPKTLRVGTCVAAGIAFLSVFAATGTPIAAAENDGEWASLFDGKTLAGWTVRCKPADRGTTFWRVDEGTILADSMDAGKHDYVWLLSDREYADFVLRLRFQAYRDSPGNSGVQVRSRYDEAAGWLDGPQVDIHPPGPWRTGMIWDETRGSKRWLWPPVPKGKWVDKSMARPGHTFYYGDQDPAWNDFEITCRGTRMKAVLNGVTVMAYDGAGVLDDAVHRKRSVGMRGHIALQIHRGDRLRIRFKDIRIRDLPR